MRLDFLFLILADMKQRKFSTFLMFLAISLGILSIFVIILISQGFENSINSQFEKIGSNRLVISVKGSNGIVGNFKKGITDIDVKYLEQRPFLSNIHPMVIKTSILKYSNEEIQSQVFGVPFGEDYFKDYDIDIKEGRFPKKNEKYSLVLGPEAAKNLWKKDVRVGSNIYINDYKFKVVGILESSGNPKDDMNIYVSLNTLRDIFEMGDRVDLIVAKVTNGYDVVLSAENTLRFFDNKFGEDFVEVQTFDQVLDKFKSILLIVQITLGGIALISLLVGALGIINMMYVIITEKTKEIGIMKAIGAKNSDIFSIYILYSGLLGFFGSLIGIFIGIFVVLGFEKLANIKGYLFLEINISLIVILFLFIFGFLIGVFAGFVPAYKASRLLIVETFRK